MRKSVNCISALLCLISLVSVVEGQENPISAEDSTQRMSQVQYILPALGYTPETNLTVGGVGTYFFDLIEEDTLTPVSNLNFFAIYSLNGQLLLQTRWKAYAGQSRWRFQGVLGYYRYPDRNYGIGNDAGAQIIHVDNKEHDTLNYLNYEATQITFAPAFLRQVLPNLYIGLALNLEEVSQLKVLGGTHQFLDNDSHLVQSEPIAGLRSGLGFQLLFDNRDYLLNPLKGNFIQFDNFYFSRLWGSDFQYSALNLDARNYVNTFKNHSFAIRVVGSARFTKDEIPIGALSRVGGYRFLRGYFRGTFQDRHMIGYEVEYRLPLWKEGTDDELWKFWKRLGVAAFFGGGQVFSSLPEVGLAHFNLAVGAGLGFLIDSQSRANLRIDFATGLSRGPVGFNKRQRGFYFHFGEAF